MAFLSPVHGGGGHLVSRMVASLGDNTELLPRVVVRAADLTSLRRIADGTLSPLTGPMGREDYDTVLATRSIVRGGRHWAWTIPIVLPVTDVEAAALAAAAPGTPVALVAEGDPAAQTVVGVLKVTSVFDWDKDAFILAVYGTTRKDHPGARIWTEDTRIKLVGGDIDMLPFVDERPFASRVLGPKAIRSLISDRGYGASVAFQTRNPLHRAHEYALVYGAETLLRQVGDAHKVGVFLNPLVGQLKGDDVPADVRMATYAKLIDDGLLGDGDIDTELWTSRKQSLKDQVHLAGLDMRMFYGGPSEAVMHAIYRQNLGFSHFIIGRKHADAPYDDNTPIWGDFDAQEIFHNLKSEIHIKTVNVGFAAFFEELGRVALLENHPGMKTVTISGTKMRDMLNSGEMPDSRVMRPGTAKILMEQYRKLSRA